MPAGEALVTGAFSYTGSFVAQELLKRGHRVRTLTSHPRQPASWADEVEVHPYRFDDPEALRRSLEGVDVLVNTYWVRFPRRGIDYDDAVQNIRILLDAAKAAGVQRVVHVSVSNPSHDSPFPYYQGKAQAEDLVRHSGLSYAIVRPTWIYAEGDVLLNNVAWLLRHFPFFAMPGDGTYRVQPIFAPDLANIIADFAASRDDVVRDAAGPDIMPFKDVVTLVQKATGARRPVLNVPPALALGMGTVAGLAVRDVVLTRYEVGGLMAELLISSEPPLGRQHFAPWLAANGDALGRRWASELDRHFRGINLRPFQRR